MPQPVSATQSRTNPVSPASDFESDLSTRRGEFAGILNEVGQDLGEFVRISLHEGVCPDRRSQGNGFSRAPALKVVHELSAKSAITNVLESSRIVPASILEDPAGR